MFPTIFTLGIEGVGPLTGEGSGLLITAIVGDAVIPLVQGFIADRIGIHHAFVLPVICYLYILLFAAKGQPKQRVANECRCLWEDAWGRRESRPARRDSRS